MGGYLLDSTRGAQVLSSIVFLFAFLLGSIPFGLLVSRIFKIKNLSQKGSGNIGASNVSRIAGFWPAGFLTFALDASKGVVAVLLATPHGCQFLAMLLGADGNAPSIHLSESSIWLAGFLSILGHCYPPWLHFRGGKGVATTLGVALVISPIAALFGVLGFGIAFLHRRIASLASLSGVMLAGMAYLVMNPIEAHLWVGVAILFLILVRHETNIDALLENKEKAFK